jgi:hypothetical protein
VPVKVAGFGFAVVSLFFLAVFRAASAIIRQPKISNFRWGYNFHRPPSNVILKHNDGANDNLAASTTPIWSEFKVHYGLIVSLISRLAQALILPPASDRGVRRAVSHVPAVHQIAAHP